jgi:hypothetical protein
MLKSHAGEFRLSVHPASTICSIAVSQLRYIRILRSHCPRPLQWSAWDTVVWYQSIAGEIRGRKHTPKGWIDCEHSVSDALKGG